MKILVQDYNEAPTAKELEAYLEKHNLNEILEVANAKRQYWQNDQATLVLRYLGRENGRGWTFHDGIALGLLAHEFSADEFDDTTEDYETFFRIWWD